jgi:hypothetical protein
VLRFRVNAVAPPGAEQTTAADEDQVGVAAKQALPLRRAQRARATPQLPCSEVGQLDGVPRPRTWHSPHDIDVVGAPMLGVATTLSTGAGRHSSVVGKSSKITLGLPVPPHS